MQIFNQPNFQFMKYKIFAFILSGIVIIAGIINMTGGKGLTGGIDFTGGTLIQIRFKDPYPITEVRQNQGEIDPKIQEVEEGEREYIIRAMSPEGETEQDQEAHEIMGKRIVDILTAEEDRIGLDKGLADLNNVDTDELTSILQTSFPENTQEIAKSIIDLRESEEFKGIIENYAQLPEAGIDQEVTDFLEENGCLKEADISHVSPKAMQRGAPQIGSLGAGNHFL